MSIRIHVFETESTEEAYNLSQCDESIRSGDVFVIESEQVIGIMDKAWPVAITKKHGEFHGPADPNKEYPRDMYPKAVYYAEQIAFIKKWPVGIAPPF